MYWTNFSCVRFVGCFGFSFVFVCFLARSYLGWPPTLALPASLSNTKLKFRFKELFGVQRALCGPLYNFLKHFHILTINNAWNIVKFQKDFKFPNMQKESVYPLQHTYLYVAKGVSLPPPTHRLICMFMGKRMTHRKIYCQFTKIMFHL